MSNFAKLLDEALKHPDFDASNYKVTNHYPNNSAENTTHMVSMAVSSKKEHHVFHTTGLDKARELKKHFEAKGHLVTIQEKNRNSIVENSDEDNEAWEHRQNRYRKGYDHAMDGEAAQHTDKHYLDGHKDGTYDKEKYK